MNQDKARELFSEYREGTLDSGLRTAVENLLANDSELKGEYLEFDRVLSGLEQSATESFEVPFDLHDRIMARIDKSVFDERRKVKTGLFSGWRLGVLAGVSMIALVATFVSINSSGDSVGVNTADAIGIAPRGGLTLTNKEGALYIRHSADNDKDILVKDDSTGKLVKRFELKGQKLDSLQENTGDSAILLRIEAVGNTDSDALFVAVPGKRSKTELTGTGNMKELAQALADTFREPVQMSSSNPSATVSWVFDIAEATHARAAQGKFSVERRQGLLHLVD